jgi:hypothetical protein
MMEAGAEVVEIVSGRGGNRGGGSRDVRSGDRRR